MGDFVLDATVFLNVQRLLVTNADHVASVTRAVTEAEMWINSELAEPLNGTAIPILTDIPPTPNIIQLMALWKASSLALMKVFGREGKADQSPSQLWAKMAEDELQAILMGRKRLVFDADGTTVGPAAQDFDTNKEPEDSPDGAERVKPYLGYGQAGEFIETDTGVEDRADIDMDNGRESDPSG